MVKNNFRSAIVSAIVMAIAACSNPVANTIPGNKENFQDLDKEYSFSSKVLTQSYLERKLLSWLGPPLKGSQLVKEIAFAMFKYEDLFRDLMLNNQELLVRIKAVDEVQERTEADQVFAAFLESCSPVNQGEFLVNSFTTGSQNAPKVAMDSDGDFVVTWANNISDGTYSIFRGHRFYNYQYDISAQRYNSTGLPAGSEFLVNTFTTGNQLQPSVAMDSNGDFIITWTSTGDQDGSGYGIYAQRYNSAGQAQGSEFRVNTHTSDNQDHQSVAMDSAGDFVISWMSYNQDGYLKGVFAQRYGSTGSPNGTEFQVNTYTSSFQTNPAVAMDSDGDFVVIWQSYNQEGDLLKNGIYAQRYNSDGSKPATNGSEFRVNTYTIDYQSGPSVAMDFDGDFIVAWNSAYQDGHSYGIFAQRFNSTGSPAGSEFQVNTYTFANQDNSSVAMDNAGNFVVSWQSQTQDESGYGIYARRYNSSGLPIGSEFRVNTFTTDNQKETSVAMDSNGEFVISWNSSYDQDGEGYGIFAQRYNSNGTGR
jgi:hypothetical protein